MHWKKEKTNLNHYRCDHPAFKVSSIPLDTLPRCCRPWLVGWRTHRGSLQTLSRCSTALRQTTTFYGQSWLQSRAPAAIFLFPRSHILMHRWVRSSFHVAGMAVCNSHVSQLVSTGSELMALPGILQFQRQAWCVFHHVFSPRFLDQSLSLLHVEQHVLKCLSALKYLSGSPCWWSSGYSDLWHEAFPAFTRLPQTFAYVDSCAKF